eukprot:TRINITY_DN3476_c0_g1_i3.p1 TRINITY_DN3476_c0_g1~~TRINITY_DN3476_c0_g1_i3.p1  ORF type:complete len:400 (-),score=66.52 TRINITY_DN3476_c0_g1_i3:606-1805(-)
MEIDDDQGFTPTPYTLLQMELTTTTTSTNNYPEKTEVVVFGWDITYVRTWVQLSVVVGGIFSFHIVHGIALERIFLYQGFVYGWFLTFVQFTGYMLMSVLYGQTRQHVVHDNLSQVQLKWFVLIGGFMIITIGLSNYSLTLVSYPVQQLLRSGKIIPVMIGGKIVLSRKYSWQEYISAVFIAIGLCLTALEKSSSVKSDSGETHTGLLDSSQPMTIGLVLLLVAMMADAFVSNLQEKMLKDFEISQENLVFQCYRIGWFGLSIILLFSGELFPAVMLCMEFPGLVVWLLVFSLTGYLGLICVVTSLKLYGAFAAVTITSTRKMISISLSFILFPKPLSLLFITAVIFVFTGIFLHIYAKNQKEIDNWCRQLVLALLHGLVRDQQGREGDEEEVREEKER